MTPSTLAASDFLIKAGACLFEPGVPTCLGSSPATLDFFLASAGFGQAREHTTTTVREEVVRPHLVVQLRFLLALRKISIRKIVWANTLAQIGTTQSALLKTPLRKQRQEEKTP